MNLESLISSNGFLEEINGGTKSVETRKISVFSVF